MCDYYSDSIGFWLITKDGNNMRRATAFELDFPAWSPDGKWIAFCNSGQIYKMSFDGNNFDTAHIIPLTRDSSNHFYPSWSLSGDTIYYDCNKDELVNTISYSVWKMAAGGTGQINIGNKGMDSISSREPYCIITDHILHIRPVNYAGLGFSTGQVFTMDTNGNSVIQITNNTDSHNGKDNPRYFNDKIFFEDYGICNINTDGTDLKELCPNSTQGFSISKDGIIAYVNFGNTDTSKIDKIHGTIWLVNADGSNQRPFTFNNY